MLTPFSLGFCGSFLGIILIHLLLWTSTVFAASKIELRATYVGTATMILEIGGANPIRILTDPALDPAGTEYSFPDEKLFDYGLHSTKTLGPELPAHKLGRIDLALVSHEGHGDNLDILGKMVINRAPQILTTPLGSQHLQRDLPGRALGVNLFGMKDWSTQSIITPEGWTLTVMAVPALHGQPVLPWFPRAVEAVVGETIGFLLFWPGQENGPVYISGDTVYFDGIADIAARFPYVSVAFLHLGAVKFKIPLAHAISPVGARILDEYRYTFNGVEAARVAGLLRAKTIVPIHYEGWTHFSENLFQSLEAFHETGLIGRIKYLPKKGKSRILAY